MTKKILLLALCYLLLPLGFSAQAQQPKKIPRIGYVRVVGLPSTPSPNVEAFRRGLRDLGYVEGENIVIEFRYAEGKRERTVAELVQLKVDVFVSTATPAVRAAKQASKTIPIVMVITSDPVVTDIIDSLARPGGNITGLTLLTHDLSGKRLELLREMVPGISRVGVLQDANSTSAADTLKEYEAPARALKIPLQSLEVHGPKP